MQTMGRRGTTDVATPPVGLVLLLDRVADSLLGVTGDRESWGAAWGEVARSEEPSVDATSDADLRLRRRAAIEQASRRRARRRLRRLGLRVR
ncbi:MAG TPA: hypothetical protein VFS29_02985 [Motilibacteraceae bacterium]|nr:hypothetical protein [Motilibacteraceae bacterium]